MKHQGNRNVDYKWVIVALSFLMVMICLGFCSSTKSLYIAPITEALGIKRGIFSINDSVRYVTTAVVNVFFGSLINRFGTKKLICAGCISLILSQLIYSFAEHVMLFYLGGVFLGLGLSWTTTTMVGAIVNKWCKEKKGTIMGAVLAANGLGAAAAIQILTPVIESSVFGFRDAYRLVALILLVVCVVLMLFFRDEPSDGETSDAGHPKKKSRSREWMGIEYRKAVKMPYFYCALVCIFLTGLILQSVTGVAAAHMRDCGLDATYIGTVLSLHSLALTGFKFLTGVLYDRFGLRITANLCSATAAVVMVLLMLITDSLAGKIFAMIYGIFSAFALPLETILLPIYAGDLFGQKSFDQILGIFVSVNTAGYAVGAPMINLIFDRFGSYNMGFLFCAVLMVGVIIAMQFVINTAQRHQTQQMEGK